MSINLDRSAPSGIAPAEWPVASITIFDRLEDVEPDWRALLAVATVSPYQAFETLKIWQDTIGRDAGAKPFIVIARDATGRAIALLPFTIVTRGTMRVARFLGGRDTNFNLGLFSPGLFDKAVARRLLLEAGRQATKEIDIYDLRRQPRRFNGFDNPMAFPDAPDSASFAYGMTLPTALDELSARFSKDTRKKLRKKEARLAEFGALSYVHCAKGERVEAIVCALIEQKSARFAGMGVETLLQRAKMRDFLRQSAEEAGEGALELHALSVDARIVATYAGYTRNGRFSAMLNSFEMDDDIARSSPGDLLLHALLRNLVARGMTHFDLGVGEARYKQSVCDETIELCDAVVPVTAKGVLIAPLIIGYLRAKRYAKHSPRLSRAVSDLRRLLARSS